MFFSQQDSEKKINKLLQEHEALNSAIDALFKESDISQEALARFEHLKAKLSLEELKSIAQEKEKLKSRSELDLEQVRDPKEMEKRYKERNVPPTWLFVR